MKKQAAGIHSDFVRWVLTPRWDKTLPETEYKTNNKPLSFEKAEKYLSVFEQHLNEFEEAMQDMIADLIDAYLGR